MKLSFTIVSALAASIATPAIAARSSRQDDIGQCMRPDAPNKANNEWSKTCCAEAHGVKPNFLGEDEYSYLDYCKGLKKRPAGQSRLTGMFSSKTRKTAFVACCDREAKSAKMAGGSSGSSSGGSSGGSSHRSGGQQEPAKHGGGIPGAQSGSEDELGAGDGSGYGEQGGGGQKPGSGDDAVYDEEDNYQQQPDSGTQGGYDDQDDFEQQPGGGNEAGFDDAYDQQPDTGAEAGSGGQGDFGY